MDLRKHNGNKGHSTKAKGIDKRKNIYKDALADALDVEDIANVLKMLYAKAIEEKDTNASKILLEYYLVKKTTTTIFEGEEVIQISFED